MQAQFYTCLELGVCAHDLLLMPWCFGIVIATLQGPQVLEANFCRLTLKPFRTAFKPFGCTSWLLALSGLWLLSEDVVWKVLPCLESLFVKETDKKKIVYHAAMEWLHCPGKGINDNGVSCRNSNKSACTFCFSCFFFLLCTPNFCCVVVV